MQGVLYAGTAQLLVAVGVQIISKKLAGFPSMLVPVLLPAISGCILLPMLWWYRHDITGVSGQDAGWLLLAALTWVVLPGALMVRGVQISDPRLVSLTALLFPFFVAVIERQISLRFAAGFGLMSAGFIVAVAA